MTLAEGNCSPIGLIMPAMGKPLDALSSEVKVAVSGVGDDAMASSQSICGQHVAWHLG